MKFVLATANPDKAAEIRAILAPSGHLELLARPQEVPEVEENGDSLLANARLKAKALMKSTGMPAIADDTGLEVEALGGAPGVRSSRFAGEVATYAENVAKLLAELDALPDRGGQRAARFVTAAVVAFPDGTERSAIGSVSGTIAFQARGEHGFGYDPVFVPDEAGGRTFAELPAEAKHAISHRGRAMRALARLVRPEAGADPSPGTTPDGSLDRDT